MCQGIPIQPCSWPTFRSVSAKNKKGHPKGGLSQNSPNSSLSLGCQLVLNQRLNHRLQYLLRHPLHYIRAHLRHHPRHQRFHIHLLSRRRFRVVHHFFHRFARVRRLFRRGRLHVRNKVRLCLPISQRFLRLAFFHRRARSISRFRHRFRRRKIQRGQFIRASRNASREHMIRFNQLLLLANFRNNMGLALLYKLVHHRARTLVHRRSRLFLQKLLGRRNTRWHRRRRRIPGCRQQRRFLRFQFPRRIRHARPVRGPRRFHALWQWLNHRRIRIHRSSRFRGVFIRSRNLFLHRRRQRGRPRISGKRSLRFNRLALQRRNTRSRRFHRFLCRSASQRRPLMSRRAVCR